MTTRRATIKRQKDRLFELRLAYADESKRFGEAVAATGEQVTIQTAFGLYCVYSVNVETWEAVTGPAGQSRSVFSQRNFLIHDGQWAGMLAQVGVARHPLFQEAK